MKHALLLLLAGTLLLAQQTTKPDKYNYHVHNPLAAVPTMTGDALLPTGCTGTCGVNVTSGWLVNTNASTVVTVTLTCKTSTVVFVKAAIPGVTTGGNNIPLQLPEDGIWCSGGVTWVASGSGVNGSLTGRY